MDYFIIYHLYIDTTVDTTYILPSGGLYATYHPLQEPEKSIDLMMKRFTTSKTQIKRWERRRTLWSLRESNLMCKLWC